MASVYMNPKVLKRLFDATKDTLSLSLCADYRCVMFV